MIHFRRNSEIAGVISEVEKAVRPFKQPTLPPQHLLAAGGGLYGFRFLII